MNKLGAGISLIAIAAFLFGINYLGISIFASGLMVRSGMTLTTYTLPLTPLEIVLRSVAIIIGIAGVSIVIAELRAITQSRGNRHARRALVSC